MTTRKIPFARASLGQKEFDDVQAVLESGWITTGPRVKKFEEAFADFCGTKHACAVSSCTAAMHVSLLALGVERGDEVITSVVTFPSTANVIVHCGATPIFCDVDPKTANIDPDALKKLLQEKYKLDPRTNQLKNIDTGAILKGITVVHYAGHACDMAPIKEIVADTPLFIMEDVAHSIGATYNDVKTGNLGDVGCFSFYATKNMTTAEGGMVTTNDDELIKKIRLLANHGITKDSWSRYSAKNAWQYQVAAAGYKYNMTDIQAALGLNQLERLESFTEKRKRLVRLYLQDLEEVEGIESLQANSEENHVHHLFPILIDEVKTGINRDDLSQELTKRGIGNSVHFIPLHLQPFFQEEFGYKEGDFPAAEKLFTGLLSLPLSAELTEDDVHYIVENIKDITS